MIRVFYSIVHFILCFTYIISSDLCEEGCRYQRNLQANLVFQGQKIEQDFLSDHVAMARVIQSDEDDGQYSSLIRFRSVMFVNGEIVVGNPICLTSMELIELFLKDNDLPENIMEVGFTSGMYNAASKDGTMMYGTNITLQIINNHEKKDILTLRPPLHKRDKSVVANQYPIRFAIYNYVDPGLLEDQLKRRYVAKNNNSVMSKGNYDRLIEAHFKTLQSLENRRKNLTQIMREMTQKLMTDDASIVMKSYEEQLRATQACHSNPQTNSYNCAEQAQFTFLSDRRVLEYLKRRLDVNNANFIGLIVHEHCSHTPCHTCATTLTRESENGGLLYNISNGKPVHVICSCQKHYERPSKGDAKMLPYQQTSFYEELKKTTSQHHQCSFDSSFTIQPYPIVLLCFNPKDNSFSIDEEHYKRLIEDKK